MSAPGQYVRATTDGTVKRHGYADDIKYGLRLIEVETADGYLQRFLYTDPSAEVGTEVNAGQVIGTAQSLLERYGKEMTHHVHFDVRKPKEPYIDPTPLFSPLLFGK